MLSLKSIVKTDFANLPPKYLDRSISNLHKSLLSIDNPTYCVKFNATKFSTLHAIQIYFLDQINCNTEPELADVTALDVDDAKFMWQDYIEHIQPLALTEGLGTVTIPKLILSDRTDFKLVVIKYMRWSIGRNGIPLLYVISESNEGDIDDDYTCMRDKLVNCIQLSGPVYQADNGNILSLLVQHMKNTEGTSMVKKNSWRRDGRKAWQDLLLHFEGDIYKEYFAQEASAILRNSTYNGSRQKFTFGDYPNRDASAHVKLRNAGKPTTTKQKIGSFIQGCQCATAHSIIVDLVGNHRVHMSYNMYYNTIFSKLELLLSLTNKQGNREAWNVNAFKTGDSTNHKFRINQNLDKNKKIKPDSTTRTHVVLEDHNYPFKEWKGLSADQQKKVKEVYRNRKTSTQSYTIYTTQTPYQTDIVLYKSVQ